MQNLREKLNIYQQNYIVAKTNLEKMKALETEIKLKILKNNEFYEKDNFSKRITDPFYDFLMNDDDFNLYLDLLQVETKRKGLKLGREEVITYEAEKELTQAEEKLLDWGEQIVKNKNDLRLDVEDFKKMRTYNLKYRNKLIDLTMKVQENKILKKIILTEDNKKLGLKKGQIIFVELK